MALIAAQLSRQQKANLKYVLDNYKQQESVDDTVTEANLRFRKLLLFLDENLCCV